MAIKNVLEQSPNYGTFSIPPRNGVDASARQITTLEYLGSGLRHLIEAVSSAVYDFFQSFGNASAHEPPRETLPALQRMPPVHIQARHAKIAERLKREEHSLRAAISVLEGACAASPKNETLRTELAEAQQRLAEHLGEDTECHPRESQTTALERLHIDMMAYDRVAIRRQKKPRTMIDLVRHVKGGVTAKKHKIRLSRFTMPQETYREFCAQDTDLSRRRTFAKEARKAATSAMKKSVKAWRHASKTR